MIVSYICTIIRDWWPRLWVPEDARRDKRRVNDKNECVTRISFSNGIERRKSGRPLLVLAYDERSFCRKRSIFFLEILLRSIHMCEGKSHFRCFNGFGFWRSHSFIFSYRHKFRTFDSRTNFNKIVFCFLLFWNFDKKSFALFPTDELCRVIRMFETANNCWFRNR